MLKTSRPPGGEEACIMLTEQFTDSYERGLKLLFPFLRFTALVYNFVHFKAWPLTEFAFPDSRQLCSTLSGKFQLSHFLRRFYPGTNFSGRNWRLGRSSHPDARGESGTNKNRRLGNCRGGYLHESIKYVHFAYSVSVHLDVKAGASDCDHGAGCTHLEWWR